MFVIHEPSTCARTSHECITKLLSAHHLSVIQCVFLYVTCSSILFVIFVLQPFSVWIGLTGVSSLYNMLLSFLSVENGRIIFNRFLPDNIIVAIKSFVRLPVGMIAPRSKRRRVLPRETVASRSLNPFGSSTLEAMPLGLVWASASSCHEGYIHSELCSDTALRVGVGLSQTAEALHPKDGADPAEGLSWTGRQRLPDRRRQPVKK